MMAPPACAWRLFVDLPCGLDARPETVPVGLVTGLGIDDILLLTVDAVRKPAGALGALGDGRIDLPAQTVVEHEARRDLPCVLHPDAELLRLMAAGPMCSPFEK